MKRILPLLFSFAMIFIFCFNTFAAIETTKPSAHKSVEYLEDSSYIETIITEEKPSLITLATTTKIGSKRITHKNSDGEVLWTATLKGTFTYTGSNATCTASSITYSVENTKWKITSATASKSGNKATGDVTAKRYVLGIPVQTVEKAITLACSASGTLS